MRRLKTREQYETVLASEPILKTAHFAMHIVDAKTFPGQPDIWIGAMAPKRWAKRAVTRNLIKRQIYNVAQRLETNLSNQAHVIRLRKGLVGKEFKSASSERLKFEVRTELEGLFNLVRQVTRQAS